ncbi:MAG: hypothetical protein ACK40K_06200 [Raineya sp.]
MKYTLIFFVLFSFQITKAQNLYLKFNQTDNLLNSKLHGVIQDYGINRYGYWEEQVLYSFYGKFTTPHVVASIEWWKFDEHFITIDKNNFQLIEESAVSSYNPLNIEQLGAVLQPKHPRGRSEYFNSFEKIFIIEVGLPNNKAKVIEVKRYLGYDTKW